MASGSNPSPWSIEKGLDRGGAGRQALGAVLHLGARAGETRGSTSKTRSKGQERGDMLPWAVRDLKSGEIVGSTRYHDIIAGRRPRRDRLHLVRAALPAHAREHGLQAAAASPTGLKA